MFTGITQEVVHITALEPFSHGLRVSLTHPSGNCALGDSILLNGICSTITAETKDAITVEFMPETLRLTTVQWWKVGQDVNAEFALTLQDKLSGSLVSGHVDALGTVSQIQPEQNEYKLSIAFDPKFQSYLVLKGGITVDGVNLTITDVKPGEFSVHLIPFTLEQATLRSLEVGAKVNLEFDYFAKVIINHIQKI